MSDDANTAPIECRRKRTRDALRLAIAQAIVVVGCALAPALAIEPALLRAGLATERWAMLITAAAAAAGGLLLVLLLLRRSRREIQPLLAIEQGLRSYAAGVESELTALALSDSLGQTAEGWNQLIAQLQQLRQHAPRSSHGSALDRFENRSLRRTLERVPFGVVRFGLDERVKYANAAAAKLLDQGDAELEGKALSDLLGEECACPLLNSLRRGAGSRSMDRVRGEDAKRKTLRLEVLGGGADDADRDALLLIQDVTHLQEAEQARDNLLYHVTHELRTPLTNIQAYAETLSRIDLDDEQTRKECYNVIVSETSRLSRLIEDILSISQLEVGSLRVEWADVELVRLLRQIVQDNLGHADEKKINLTLKLPPKAPNIRGDKQKLAVLFNNLIGNAIKYTREGGRVDVRLEAEGDVVRLAVADTGIGIAAKDLPHVFEKFYRAAAEEVQQVKGTGLGLAIAREVAVLHGGDIRAESEVGKGTTFTVELPVHTAAAA